MPTSDPSEGMGVFSAITVREYGPLGHDTKVELEPHRTIFFGRNAAGKSALIEGISAGLRAPLSQAGRHSGPHGFRADFLDGMAYEYSWSASLPTELEDTDPGAFPVENFAWEERCWSDALGSKLAWSLEGGVARIAIEGQVVPNTLSVPAGSSLVSMNSREASVPFPPELRTVRAACLFAKRIQAGIPRDAPERSELFLRPSTVRQQRQTVWRPVGYRGLSPRFVSPFTTLFRWHQHGAERYAEFIDIGRTLNLFKDVDVSIYKLEGEVASSTEFEPNEMGQITFDGCNAGLLSDGTLRIIEIIVALLSLVPESLLLIEEPETAIHPGMLIRLLNIIDSYTIDRQVVFSTHSPLVVNRAKPGELRLIQRINDATQIRRLEGGEIEDVARYLEDEGTLGEFIFSGGIDDDS